MDSQKITFEKEGVRLELTLPDGKLRSFDASKRKKLLQALIEGLGISIGLALFDRSDLLLSQLVNEVADIDTELSSAIKLLMQQRQSRNN